jgi:hypothetical protein
MFFRIIRGWARTGAVDEIRIIYVSREQRGVEVLRYTWLLPFAFSRTEFQMTELMPHAAPRLDQDSIH